MHINGGFQNPGWKVGSQPIHVFMKGTQLYNLPYPLVFQCLGRTQGTYYTYCLYVFDCQINKADDLLCYGYV